MPTLDRNILIHTITLATQKASQMSFKLALFSEALKSCNSDTCAQDTVDLKITIKLQLSN